MSRLATTLGVLIFLFVVPPLLALGCTPSSDDGESLGAQDQSLGNPVTITVSTPPAVAPTAALLNATGSITVGSVAAISGTAVQRSSTGDVGVGAEATLQDVWAKGAAIVGGLAHINGTLHAATTVIDPSAVIAHKDTHPAFTPLNKLSWQATIPNGTTNVHVASGKTTAITPGAFNTVQADTGATLKLQAGVYYANTLTISQGSTVSLDQSHGAVIVYVSNAITLNGTFKPVQSGPANLLVAFLGTGNVTVGGSAGAAFGGDIVAPTAQLSLLDAPSAHAGFFAAQNIVIDAAATIQYSPPTAVVAASGMMGSDAGADGGDAGDSGHDADAAHDAADGEAAVDSGPDGADASEGGDAADTGSDADASEAGLVTACGFDAGVEQLPVRCGNGWVDPTEECDSKGLGSACSSSCQVNDFLSVPGLVANAGADAGDVTRTLGTGRHPIAAAYDNTFAVSSLDLDHMTLTLAGFGPSGVPLGAPVAFGAPSMLVQDSAQVIAALPCDHRYAAAWAQIGAAAGDELDIGLQIVDPTAGPVGATALANTTVAGTQRAADVLTVGNEVVVAWEDDSNPATAPDVVLRTFDANLNATSGEQVLAGTGDSEADVALAAFEGLWAAAWRDDANGMETVHVQAGANRWSVQPSFLPAPVAVKPALVELDSTHLLLVYAAGLDRTGSGVADGSTLELALLQVGGSPGVTGLDLPATVTSAAGLDQSQPSAVVVQGSVYVAWWTAAAPGDPNGEQLWLKKIALKGSGFDLSQAEIPLPRWTQAQTGDQRLPALAASTLPPGGAIVAAWDDLGRAIAAGEWNGDVVVEVAPSPVLRTGGDGGP